MAQRVEKNFWTKPKRNTYFSPSCCRAKYVNTCSYDFGAPAMVQLRVIRPRYIDRGRLYELNGAKIIVLGGLEVEIINIYVFTSTGHLVYYSDTTN